MCGLFGFSGNNPVDLTKLRWLAVSNENRGTHSTGVYTIKNNKTKTRGLYKDVGAADSVILRPEFNHNVIGAFTVQGHTRHATVGSINKPNAHPFEFDFSGVDNGTYAVGAHNGFVLKEFPKDVPQYKKFGFDKDFDVDSMLIFAALAKTGDYSILPQIEGGIACSFQMPDKHKNALFLYQSSGRELHVGLAPEGIYYSSESKPLKMIGCRNIQSIPYNTMLVLEDGVILDAVSMPKPEISIAYNAKRDTFTTRLTDVERKKMGLESVDNQCSIYGNGYGSGYRKKTEAPATTGSTTTMTASGKIKDEKTSRENQDFLGVLINDVKDAVEALVDEPLQFSRTTSYGVDETSSCLMVIKLLASTKNQPLPGWAIFSAADEKIAGITALNGVTVLKFNASQCGKKHTLKLTCPVDLENASVFSVEVDPISARVMEVTLNIPFPQKDSPKTTGDQDDNRDDARKTILGLGESELSIHSRGNIKIGGIVSDSTEDEQVLLAENEQINIGSKEGKDSGTSGREGKDDEPTDGDAAVYKGQYLGPNSGNRSDRGKLSKKVIPLLNIQNMRAIISSENKTFEYKNQVKRALLSQEYSLAISKWREELNNKIDLRRIFSDAAVLKIHDFNLWGDCYSLQLYAWRLAVYCFDDYRMRIFSEEDYREINKTLGKLIHSHTNDEGEEVASVKKQPKWRKVEIIE